jgi:hypothetical protein
MARSIRESLGRFEWGIVVILLCVAAVLGPVLYAAWFDKPDEGARDRAPTTQSIPADGGYLPEDRPQDATPLYPYAD